MRIFALLQSILFIVSSFSVTDSNFKMWVDRAAVDITSEKELKFNPVSASELIVSESEKQRCREWFEKNVLFTGGEGSPAYDFKIDGKSFKKNVSDWSFEKGEPERSKSGETTVITLTHKKSGLKVRVRGTIYENRATCEWTVYIKNTAQSNSPVIKDFYAADCGVETGISDLYVSKGSDPAADDFQMKHTFVNFIPMRFTANGGRTESFLPYFNISGKTNGAVLALGWTGQWYASLAQRFGSVAIKAKQEEFNAYLLPGEEVRSPLVSLTFYDGDNPLKGFNTFRDWQKDITVIQGENTSLNGFVIANEFSTLTCDQMIEKVNSIDESVMNGIDYFWMDASWYKYNEGWYDGVGNWIPDENRFPNTIKPLSDAMAAKGKKFLLWYEPERVRENTVLYNKGVENKGWTVQIDDNIMWNMANDGACDYLCEYILNSMKTNGVSMYRQDFNFTPLAYWEKSDKEYFGGRTGITENHYVTNLYRYLDFLLEGIDGLVIDNCASGGKRLDIEMMRRSVPLWRSDYNCGNEDGTIKDDVLEATQSMTYGLSFWIPYSGTNRYFHSEYASRSAILTHQSTYDPPAEEFTKYSKVSEYMTGRYFPLTDGGTDLSAFHAMQFDCGNASEGAAVIYKREKAEAGEYRLVLNGLDPEALYSVYSVDFPDNVTEIKGSRLMQNGITIPTDKTPGAYIVFYAVK